MPLFANWFNTNKDQKNKAFFWLLKEQEDKREKVINYFCETVRSHYDDLNKIADDIAALGYSNAAKLLKEQLPSTKRARSGELGEIMATEFAEEGLGFRVPVRRIRYKDGREMALRGDDFIGLKYGKSPDDIILLKGESKSSATLGKTTIQKAREVLDRDAGRCTPISLLFVANRLMEGDLEDQKLGRSLRNEVAIKAIKPSNIHHAFFSLTGNDPEKHLREDLDTADKKRNQNVINIQITDHQKFIKETFEKVATLGKD
jgi:hypothetical protein